MYGGTPPLRQRNDMIEGLSPRVRGNPLCHPARPAAPGSIPACTGEPCATWNRKCCGKVYPRVYGGTRMTSSLVLTCRGLSPRVRGNPPLAPAERYDRGSIPACTGEPIVPSSTSSGSGVYPRVYGGTLRDLEQEVLREGLSPRVRGNPSAGAPAGARAGSIPACTGEPRGSRRPETGTRVYPRVYGGTRNRSSTGHSRIGLSPRVRGNLIQRRRGLGPRGSIPACTGEPGAGIRTNGPCRVYPRVYGGTLVDDGHLIEAHGLSPRVRGNPRGGGFCACRARSIPACTGEPKACTRRKSSLRVYPRVYGGTAPRMNMGMDALGLSPRVRGNLRRRGRPADMRRSIPACTGEPWIIPATSAAAAVYPRVYGGTYGRSGRGTVRPGLSPRVRGNRGPP